MEVYRECPIGNAPRIFSLYTFSRQNLSRDYKFHGESHDFFEAVCITEGRAGITAGRNVFTVSRGLVVHAPNEYHNVWSDGVEVEAIIFSFRAEGLPPTDGAYPLSPELVREVRALYGDACRTLDLDGANVTGVRAGREAAAAVLLKKLEIFLIEALGRGRSDEAVYRSRSADNLLNALAVMERLLGTDADTREIAAACNLSVPTLEKTMRRYAGSGAMEYFNAMKIRRAAELLASGTSVKETAYALGFSDPNYFSAVFKRHKGVPPTVWRQT